MQIDFEQTLQNMDGEPMVENYASADGEQRKRPLTLGRACIIALVDPRAAEGLSPSEKYDAFTLAMRVGRGAELTTDEVVRIKTAAGKTFDTWAMGQVWSRLEGET